MAAYVNLATLANAVAPERADVCIDRCMDMCIDMCIDMGVDLCIDMCIDMCIDIGVDMCIDMANLPQWPLLPSVQAWFKRVCADMCIRHVCTLGLTVSPESCTHMYQRTGSCIGVCRDMCINIINNYKDTLLDTELYG